MTNRKNLPLPFNTVFFKLSIAKSFEILHKHNAYDFISESFTFN